MGEIQIDVTAVINALIALLGVIITAVLLPLIRAHTSVCHCRKIKMWVWVAVAAAEQQFKGPGRGTEKKNYVLKFLYHHNLTYDEPALDALIESSVKLLNIAQEKTINGAEILNQIPQ